MGENNWEFRVLDNSFYETSDLIGRLYTTFKEHFVT